VRLGILLFMLFATPAATIHAAEIYLEKGTVFIVGEIAHEDVIEFRRTVMGYLRHPEGQGLLHRVIIYSPGGDLKAAMAIGHHIRRLNLSTKGPQLGYGYFFGDYSDATCTIRGKVVEYNRQSGTGDPRCTCASACFFLWAAGAWRVKSQILIHRPYFNKEDYRDLSVDDAKKVYDEIMLYAQSYLDKMGISQLLIEKLFTVSSATVEPLSAEDQEALMYEPFMEELLIAKCGGSFLVDLGASRCGKTAKCKALKKKEYRLQEERTNCYADAYGTIVRKSLREWYENYGP